jgi:hypothetical protein
MAYRRRLKNKKPPEGWELIEEVIEDFEGQMKEAVNEEHEGRRKNELAWKIHRIHWEKNRFIFDLMYQRKVMSKDLVRLQTDVCRAATPRCVALHQFRSSQHCHCVEMVFAMCHVVEMKLSV